MSLAAARGIGGNTALRNAASLCKQLVAARGGEKPLLQGIHDYEREMVKYGFAAVRASRQNLNVMVTESSVSRLFTKAVLKLLGGIVALKQ